MINSARLAAAALLLAALTRTALPFQQPQQAQGELPDVWLIRARALSDDLAGDSPALALHDRALLWARLGEVWWADDRERARGLMKKAVEEVEVYSEQESAAARSQRLRAARAILPVIAPRDAGLGERLTAVLSAKPKGARAGEDGEGEGDAGALLDLALEVVETDPRRAYQLGAAAVRLGPNNLLFPLLRRLYRRDAALGGALYTEGLSAARASRSEALLHTVASAAFPHRLVFPPIEGDDVRGEVRAAVLQLVAENLLRPVTTPEAEREVCSVSWFAASLLADFAAHLPQQASAARIVINRCLQKESASFRQYVETELERKLDTPEGYLQAARDAKDEGQRQMYTARAAYLAGSNDRPELAVEILDGMDAALRDRLGDTWEDWRGTFAAALALQHFKRNDRPAARRVLDAVPPKLRAFTLIELMSGLSESGERNFPLEMLAEARAALDKSTAPEQDKQHWWLKLTRLHAAHAPADGPLVFNETVASINRAARAREDTPAANGDLPPDFPWQAMRLPLRLVEADEAGVTSAVASVEPAGVRVQARLGLLNALLEKRRAESPATTTRTKAKPPAREKSKQ